MADSKTYLNVPYAQKDEAKALGARWDAANKKWYVPSNKDSALFVKWQTDTLPQASSSTTNRNSRTSGSKSGSTSDNTGLGVITYPTVENFIPYDGDEPPWD